MLRVRVKTLVFLTVLVFSVAKASAQVPAEDLPQCSSTSQNSTSTDDGDDDDDRGTGQEQELCVAAVEYESTDGDTPTALSNDEGEDDVEAGTYKLVCYGDDSRPTQPSCKYCEGYRLLLFQP